MTRRTMNTKRRIGVAAAVLLCSSALAGCGEMSNPVTTELHYDAADGVSTSVGNLEASNLLIVNNGKAVTGEMQGLINNPTASDETLTISVNGQNQDVKIPAGRSVRLDGKSNGYSPGYKVPAVKIDNLGKQVAGDEISVTLKTANAGSVQKDIPILLNQYPYGSAKVSHPESAGEASSASN